MRPGWNPVRRNRKSGTKARGHGLNNKMVIPESWHSLRRYWESLSSFVLVTRKVGNKEQLFFVEPAKSGWFYPCTIDDIVMLLQGVNSPDLEAFDFIVLRQPTRKQRILCPVWGRAQFAFDIDKYQGSAIVIEAQSLGSYNWDKSLSPEMERELVRLRDDGHKISITRRKIEISPSTSSMRNTILFRTLLHEVGHHVDYRRSGDVWDDKTKTEKEDFAHRYAEEQRAILVTEGFIPYEPILDRASFEKDGVKEGWFVAEAAL